MNADKNTLRQILQSTRRALTKPERESSSRTVQERVFASEIWRKAEYVALYMPLHDELSTDLLRHAAFHSKKQVLLPRVLDHQGRMAFCFCQSTTPFETNSFGIQEPCSDQKALLPNDIDRLPSSVLFLLPGLAFDRKGFRLGFGGGYYDRFLAPIRQCVTLGLCFSCQLLPELPHDTWDQPLQYIATEKEWLTL